MEYWSIDYCRLRIWNLSFGLPSSGRVPSFQYSPLLPQTSNLQLLTGRCQLLAVFMPYALVTTDHKQLTLGSNVDRVHPLVILLLG